STGQPKGFVRTERQFCSRGLRQLHDFQVVPADRIFSLTSLTSGTTATWLITALQAGASIGVAAPSTLGLHGLSVAVRDARPSILVTIPTLMRLVMELPNADRLLGTVRATYSVSEP